MYYLGVTGGFLTGKSTVCGFLRRMKIKVINTDDIYRGLLSLDKMLKKHLVSEFGREILRGGRISRSNLRKRVLGNESNLSKVSEISHPYIISALKKELNSYRKMPGIIAVEVPLLYETGLENLFDKVIVVLAKKNNQVSRGLRLGYKRKQIQFFLACQLPLGYKKDKADYVLFNYKGREELYKQLKGVIEDIKNNQSLQQISA